MVNIEKVRGVLNELTATRDCVSRAYMNKVNKRLVAVAKAALAIREDMGRTVDFSCLSWPRKTVEESAISTICHEKNMIGLDDALTALAEDK